MATFTDSSATYRLKYKSNRPDFSVYKLWFNPKKRTDNGKQVFLVGNWSARSFRSGNEWHVRWKQAFALQAINRLPDLQNQYAQGKPVNGQLAWQGAETSEMFSWGPAIGGLSFDQSDYLYDKNGALTNTAGTNKAKAYNPLSFFKTVARYTSEIEATKQFNRNRFLRLLVNNQWNRGIIPGNETRSNYFKASYSDQDYYHARRKLSANIEYLNEQNRLPNTGANHQNIVRNVFITPPTFDNANGLSRKQASKTPAAYTLPDGSKRSFSTGFADNPYGIIQQIPDNNVLDHFAANVRFRHRGRGI